jgi:predicted N-formylglutamate amidohydrolase
MLHPDEPLPCRHLHPTAPGAFLLTADHAGNRIPRVLGDLGVSAADRARHIGWDIGIAGVTEQLAAQLSTTAILQTYSRLVIDCNRPPGALSAFPTVSETTPIPGNHDLTETAKHARIDAMFTPYHQMIAAEIATRRARAQPTIYVAMHSFTPVFHGIARPMHVAVLFNRNPRFSLILADLLRAEGGLTVAENDPYAVSDTSDYGIPVHAEGNGLDYTELEIRQDLIDTPAKEIAWANRLSRLLPLALGQHGEHQKVRDRIQNNMIIENLS